MDGPNYDVFTRNYLLKITNIVVRLHEGFPNLHNDLKLELPVGNGNDKKTFIQGRRHLL